MSTGSLAPGNAPPGAFNPTPAFPVQHTFYGVAFVFDVDNGKPTITIDGITYSLELFKNFGRSMPLRVPFYIDNRDDGVLTITKLDNRPIYPEPDGSVKGGRRILREKRGKDL